MAAWKTPPRTIATLCSIRSARPSYLPAVDPVVEADAGGLLDLARRHHADGIDRHEVVPVLVGGEALEEARLHDVVATIAPRPGERLHLDALERLDDLPGRWPPAADRPRGALHRRLVGDDREVGMVGFVIRPLLECLVLPADELAEERARVRRVEVHR